MSVLTLKVDEVMRTLSAESSNPFVVHDKEVDIVRFAINSGFADIVLDGQVALRVMYQRPGETEVRAQTLTYYDTDGLHNYYDWQLAQSDLAKNGALMVALCILDISGGEVSEWHTTPCVVRVLSTIHTDDSDEGDDTITPTVRERVAVLESMIQRVASGAPIVVASTSAMTDTDKIYVLKTDRCWYYYDGTAWTAGGEYGAVATDTTLTQAGIPADGEAVGDRIADLKEDLSDSEQSMNYYPTGNLYNASAIIRGKYFSPSTGKIISIDNNTFAYARPFVPVMPGEQLNSTNRMFIAFYDRNYNLLSGMQMDTSKKATVPEGVSYARFAVSSVNHDAVVVQRTAQMHEERAAYEFTLDGLMVDPFSLGVKQLSDLMNYKQGDNLYNSYNIIRRKYISPTTGNIVNIEDNETFAYSPTYIPVTAGDVLTATVRMFIAYYDKAYCVVGAMQMDNTKQTTVPQGAYFARFSCSVLHHDEAKVVKGTQISQDVGRYSFTLDGLKTNDEVNDEIIVDINGGGDFTSFTEAIYNTVNSKKNIWVMPGTYDIVAEYVALFGQDVVDNLADSTSGINNFQYGIRIHDRKVTFESGSHLVCDWTGKTVNGTHRFCALRIEPNAELISLDLDCTNTFYCIHDDYGTADNSPYTVTYKNCRVIGRNLYNANCIGGGAHKYSRHILENCYFKNNVESTSLVSSADVRYHNTNTAGAEPEVYVSNCYFSNNLNITYYGSQTTKMRAYVNNCYAPKGINKLAESSSMSTDNVELYTWNNQTN